MPNYNSRSNIFSFVFHFVFSTSLLLRPFYLLVCIRNGMQGPVCVCVCVVAGVRPVLQFYSLQSITYTEKKSNVTKTIVCSTKSHQRKMENWRRCVVILHWKMDVPMAKCSFGWNSFYGQASDRHCDVIWLSIRKFLGAAWCQEIYTMELLGIIFRTPGIAQCSRFVS